MGPYNIYNATVVWKDCADMRPWIIIGDCVGEEWECFPITGQSYGSCNFELSPSHEGFAQTGLSKLCYIHYTSVVMVPQASFKKYRGTLDGSLLDAFISEAGL